MSSKSQEIENRAAEWAVRKDAGKLTPEEMAELETWLAADIRHFGAYCKTQAVMARVGRMHGLSMFRSIPRNPSEVPLWSRRRLVVAGGAAAGAAAAGLFGVVLLRGDNVEIFSTQIGEMRKVHLNDGSVVSLNTNSELLVKFTKKTRRVQLVRGEALFDVAKDKARPFLVMASDTEVRAVGTSFSVSVLPEHPIQVLVREGVVELDRANADVSTSVRVSANIRAIAPRDAPIMTSAISQVKLERDLAWQHGRIAFENQTLEGAAKEFARYSSMRIIVDSTVAHRTVTGLFASNDPVGFAKATAALLDLQVAVSEGQVKIFDRTKKLP